MSFPLQKGLIKSNSSTWTRKYGLNGLCYSLNENTIVYGGPIDLFLVIQRGIWCWKLNTNRKKDG